MKVIEIYNILKDLNKIKYYNFTKKELEYIVKNSKKQIFDKLKNFEIIDENIINKVKDYLENDEIIELNKDVNRKNKIYYSKKLEIDLDKYDMDEYEKKIECYEKIKFKLHKYDKREIFADKIYEYREILKNKKIEYGNEKDEFYNKLINGDFEDVYKIYFRNDIFDYYILWNLNNIKNEVDSVIFGKKYNYVKHIDLIPHNIQYIRYFAININITVRQLERFTNLINIKTGDCHSKYNNIYNLIKNYENIENKENNENKENIENKENKEEIKNKYFTISHNKNTDLISYLGLEAKKLKLNDVYNVKIIDDIPYGIERLEISGYNRYKIINKDFEINNLPTSIKYLKF